MSFAKKESPVRGRILMAGINNANGGRKEKRLAGSVALVTGGSRGVGRAIAHRLAMLGASVAICGRDLAALERVAAELEKLGARALFHITDVIDAKQVSTLVAEAEAALVSPKMLVHTSASGRI